MRETPMNIYEQQLKLNQKLNANANLQWKKYIVYKEMRAKKKSNNKLVLE